MGLRDSPTLRVVVLIAYAAMTLTLTLHHEPWRDEADTWLLVRDAELGYVLSRMPYAGTPALWYVLVYPLAKIGFPYLAPSMLNLVLVIGAVALLLWFAPFPALLKLLAVFSYYLGYEYPVIARSYGLGILLLFAAAALFPRRFARPYLFGAVLFALANTNAHSFVLAALLTSWFAMGAWRKGQLRFVLGGLLVALAGLVVAVLQLFWPVERLDAPTNWPAAIAAISHGFFPLYQHEWWAIAACLILVVVCAGLARTLPVLLFVLAAIAALLGIYVFVWFGGLRHAGLILIVVLFALWIAAPARRIVYWCLAISLAFGALPLARRAVQEVRYSFSGSREVADYLRETGMEKRTIAAYQATTAEAVLPYLEGKQFWYPGIQEFGTFIKWDRAYLRGTHLSEAKVIERVASRFGLEADVLLLMSFPLAEPQRYGFELIYQTRRPVFGSDERYWLYGRSSSSR